MSACLGVLGCVLYTDCGVRSGVVIEYVSPFSLLYDFLKARVW